ncbi:hypothetical protein NXC24_CH03977 [Rhizobium sp. NXC24]|nr:hypothetical protein NXC24_CH03977 [Rhizobium sp. NXC24]
MNARRSGGRRKTPQQRGKPRTSLIQDTPNAPSNSVQIRKGDIAMDYDWDGVKTRRMKILKLGISLFIFAMTLVGPTMFLLHFR